MKENNMNVQNTEDAILDFNQEDTLPKIQLNHAVINELIIQKNNEGKNIANFGQGLKEEVLDISDELVLNLVNQVSSLLGGKNNRVYHGAFIEKSNMIKNFPFEFDKTYSLDKSSTGPTPISNEAFIIFTKSIMRRLKKSVQGKKTLEHSYILCADFILNVEYNDENSHKVIHSNSYFLIAMLRCSEKIQVDAELRPKKVEILDLNSLHQALQIDINRYISFLDQKPNILEKIDADNSEEEIIERPIYLSFVSPQSQSITTGYFAEAFSYTQGITPSKAVELLHSTIIDEFRKNEQLKHHKTLEKLSISLDRFYETYKNKVIKLEDIKAVIIQAIPTQLHHQATRIANKIINKLNSAEIGVPAEFPLTSSVANKYRKIFLDTNAVKLEINFISFGIESNKTVYFDKKNKKLEIKLNDSDVATLNNELKRLGK